MKRWGRARGRGLEGREEGSMGRGKYNMGISMQSGICYDDFGKRLVRV